MRLTIINRDQICNALIQNRFKEAEQKLKEQGYEVALMVYTEAFGEATIKQMKALPPGWLPTINHFLVRTSSGRTDSLCLKKELPAPYEKTKGYSSPMLMDAKTCNKKVEKVVDRLLKSIEQLKQDKQALKREVRAALSGFNTDKQVIEKWPEIKDLVIQFCGTGVKSTALSPRLEDLNKKLGLKS